MGASGIRLDSGPRDESAPSVVEETPVRRHSLRPGWCPSRRPFQYEGTEASSHLRRSWNRACVSHRCAEGKCVWLSELFDCGHRLKVAGERYLNAEYVRRVCDKRHPGWIECYEASGL